MYKFSRLLSAFSCNLQCILSSILSIYGKSICWASTLFVVSSDRLNYVPSKIKFFLRDLSIVDGENSHDSHLVEIIHLGRNCEDPGWSKIERTRFNSKFNAREMLADNSVWWTELQFELRCSFNSDIRSRMTVDEGQSLLSIWNRTRKPEFCFLSWQLELLVGLPVQ